MIVVAPVAADIDHRIDRGRAAEPLAARLIADPPVEARLRHGFERPVVDLARDHQDHGARRGHDPVVVPCRRLPAAPPTSRGPPTAGWRPRSRRNRRQPPQNRMNPPWRPPVFCCSKAGLLRSFWQERRGGSIWQVQAVIKSPKDRSRAFPKPPCVGTYRSHPRAFAGLPSQEASGRDRSAPSGVGRFVSGPVFRRRAMV